MISSTFNTNKEVASDRGAGGQGGGQGSVQVAVGGAKGPEAGGVDVSSSLSEIASSTSLMLEESCGVVATAASIARTGSSVGVEQPGGVGHDSA